MRFPLRDFLVRVAGVGLASAAAAGAISACNSTSSTAGVSYDYFDAQGRHCARSCDFGGGACTISCDPPKVAVTSCPAGTTMCLSLIDPNDSRLASAATVVAQHICSGCCGSLGLAGAGPIADCSPVVCNDDTDCNVDIEGYVCQHTAGAASKGICTCQGYGCGGPVDDGGGGTTTGGSDGGAGSTGTNGSDGGGGSAGTSGGGDASPDATTGGSEGGTSGSGGGSGTDAGEASTLEGAAGDGASLGDGPAIPDVSLSSDGSPDGRAVDAGVSVDAAIDAGNGG